MSVPTDHLKDTNIAKSKRKKIKASKSTKSENSNDISEPKLTRIKSKQDKSKLALGTTQPQLVTITGNDSIMSGFVV